MIVGVGGQGALLASKTLGQVLLEPIHKQKSQGEGPRLLLTVYSKVWNS